MTIGSPKTHERKWTIYVRLSHFYGFMLTDWSQKNLAESKFLQKTKVIGLFELTFQQWRSHF
jgi:hypothetical protein